MQISQPYSRFIPARYIGGDPKVPTISLTTSANIIITASVRLGSSVNVALPLISALPTTVLRNVTVSASIFLSAGPIRFGNKANIDVSIYGIASVSKQSIVTVSAVLPLISMSQRVIAAARIPLISISSIVNITSTTTAVSWISNLLLEETTKFTNFDFINVVRLGNTTYGIKSDGLYSIDSTTDNGTVINSYVKTHPQNYRQMLYKRIPYMYIQTAYPVTVTSYIDSVTEGPRATDHGQQKVTMSKGTQGYYWSYKIASIAPNSFKIDGIEPFIDFLKRRA